MENWCGRSGVTVLAISVAAATAILIAVTAAAGDAPQPFLPDIIISSTVPPKGDLNPYGVASVPAGFPSGGKIMPGDVLVSNFNNKTNAQGTGTTIVKLTPSGLAAPQGKATTFFRGSGLGLTTALGVLRRGFVLVGNVPTSGGVIQKPGSLLFLDRNGREVAPSPYTKRLNGPWDLTLNWATNLPCLVNSTISLDCAGSALTASPFAVSKSPLGASTSASGPRKCSSRKTTLPVPDEPVRDPA